MKFTNMKFSCYNENYLLGLAPNLLKKDGTFKYKTEKEYLDFALNFNYEEYQNKIKNIYLKKKILSKPENKNIETKPIPTSEPVNKNIEIKSF